METIWSFCSDGKEGDDYISHECEFLGSFDELINDITTEMYTHDWEEYTTFTKEDYDADPELYEDTPLKYDKLPEERKYYDPKMGEQKVARLKKYFEQTKNEMLKEEWLDEEEHALIMADFDKLDAFFKKLIEEKREWYLEMIIDY